MPNLDTAPRPRRFTGLSPADRLHQRRTLLLDAALDLLGTAGWSAMTVRSVLETARLNPRYFYESFSDLDQLAVALYDRVVAQLGEAIWAALAEARDAPGDQVRAVVDCTVSFVDEDRRRGRVLYAEGLGNEALNRRRVETAGMVVAFVEDHAAGRRPSGAASAELGRVATSILVGGFNQLLVDWLAGRVPISRDQLVDDATALFLALGDGAAAEAAARSSIRR
ncbi:MAG: TetR/AcrR family transcriptional regulator [Acidimicrobiales bacterium]